MWSIIRTRGVGGRFGMLVGLSVVGVGLNSWGECGKSGAALSASVAVWLSSLVFSPIARRRMSPQRYLCSKPPTPELSLSAAVFVAVLLNPNELPSRLGRLLCFRVCLWIHFSQWSCTWDPRKWWWWGRWWNGFCVLHAHVSVPAVCVLWDEKVQPPPLRSASSPASASFSVSSFLLVPADSWKATWVASSLAFPLCFNTFCVSSRSAWSSGCRWDVAQLW